MDDRGTDERTPAGGLPPDAVVVRGGVMRIELLSAQADYAATVIGVRSLSFWASPTLDEAGIVRAARGYASQNLRHKKIRVSTAGAIAQAGFQLHHSGLPEHFQILLPDPGQDFRLARLIRAFGPPHPTPS